MARQGCDVRRSRWRWLDYHGIDEGNDESISASLRRDHRRTDRDAAVRLVTSASRAPVHRRLVVEEGGFLYDSDAYNDELPIETYDYGRRISSSRTR